MHNKGRVTKGGRKASGGIRSGGDPHATDKTTRNSGGDGGSSSSSSQQDRNIEKLLFQTA